MFSRFVSYAFVMFVTCSACAPKKNEWADIDYSKVYRAGGERQFDNSYRAPSVLGCVDDDLINCR